MVRRIQHGFIVSWDWSDVIKLMTPPPLINRPMLSSSSDFSLSLPKTKVKSSKNQRRNKQNSQSSQGKRNDQITDLMGFKVLP